MQRISPLHGNALRRLADHLARIRLGDLEELAGFEGLNVSFRDDGKSDVTVTHDLDMAAPICARVALSNRACRRSPPGIR